MNSITLCFVAFSTIATVSGAENATRMTEDEAGGAPVIEIVRHWPLTCEGKRCFTPTDRVTAGNFDETKILITYRAPDGSVLIPSTARAVRLAGHGGKHEIKVKTKTESLLGCRWHAKGDHRVGGRGGFVRGYCEVQRQ